MDGSQLIKFQRKNLTQELYVYKKSCEKNDDVITFSTNGNSPSQDHI